MAQANYDAECMVCQATVMAGDSVAEVRSASASAGNTRRRYLNPRAGQVTVDHRGRAAKDLDGIAHASCLRTVLLQDLRSRLERKQEG